MANRHQRRRAAAQGRQRPEVTDRVVREVTRIASEKCEALTKLEDILDFMANEAPLMIGRADAHSEAAIDAFSKLFSARIKQMFLDAKWRGCVPATVDRMVMDELTERCALRSDLALTLTAIDRIALSCATAKQNGGDIIATAHTIYGQTLGHPVAAQCRERLTKLGWRGATLDTLEDIVCADVVENLDKHATIATAFSILEGMPQTRERSEGFDRRIEPHYKLLLQRSRLDSEILNAVEDIIGAEGGAPIESGEIQHRLHTYFETEKWKSLCDRLTEHHWRASVLSVGNLIETPPGHVHTTDDQHAITRLAFEQEVLNIAKRRFDIATSAVDTEVDALKMYQPVEHNEVEQLIADQTIPVKFTAKTFDHVVMRMGVNLWEKTYKLGMTDAQTRKLLAQGRGRDQVGTELLDIDCFAALWAVHAFQRMQTSHTFASALMCTDVDPTVLSDVQEQWRAWMVHVPNGMLVWNNRKNEISKILIAVYETHAWMTMMDMNPTGPDDAGLSMTLEAPSLSTLLSPVKETMTVVGTNTKTGTDAELHRIRELGKRLVAGLLLSLQNKDAVRVRDVEAKRMSHANRREVGEPAHRIVMLGQPLEIDCRPAIASYIATGRGTRGGDRSLPAVQWITRGHWRNQVYGPGRLGRKIIWIKPHWKGRADAPILVHARRLEGSNGDA